MKPAIPIFALLTAFLATEVAPAASGVWIEAEQFKDLGGWTNEAQFIDQMGSPYLLAHGFGIPVKDAAATIGLPLAGTTCWSAHAIGRSEERRCRERV